MEFRLRDFSYPIAITRMRRFLDRSQRWTSIELRDWQSQRLRELLEHARRSSPFWRDRLAAAEAVAPLTDPTASLARLPILTKDDVRSHFHELQATSLAGLRARRSQTSGSTGTALRFLLDRATNVLEFATLWRQFNWAGYRFGQRFADIRGHIVGSDDGLEHDWRLHSLNLSAFHLTRARAAHYAQALVRFRPVMIRGYPSSISLFAAWAVEDGLQLPRPRAVVTSSETLLEPQRRTIERAFRAPVYDYYGQAERVAFAGQCPARSYHVAPEYGIVELVDDAGDPVEPGRVGRIVATGLHHRAMPLIRYETRDLAVRSPEPCPCGRAAPVLERIVGRLEDIVRTPDGRHVGRLDAAFKYSPGIRLSRILQSSEEAITIEIVAGDGYGANDEQALMRELRRRLGDSLQIRFERVERLPLDRSGKLKFVVSTLARSSPDEAIARPTDSR